MLADICNKQNNGARAYFKDLAPLLFFL